MEKCARHKTDWHITTSVFLWPKYQRAAILLALPMPYIHQMVNCAVCNAEKREERLRDERLNEGSAEKKLSDPKRHHSRLRKASILYFRASDGQPRRTAADEAVSEAAEETGEGTEGVGAERK